MFARIGKCSVQGALLVGIMNHMNPAIAQPLQNPLGLKVHHVTASVIEIDRAIAWYRDVLGFTLEKRGSRDNGAFKFAELAIPGFGVALVQLAGTVAPDKAGTTVTPSWVHIVFSVPDPDRTFRLLKERGASVTLRENAKQNPVTTFLLHDSEGNEIEIVPAKKS